MMTAAKATTKTTPSKAARKTAPVKSNGKATPKAQASKAKADPDPKPEPEPEPEELALGVAEDAADEQVATIATHSPLYMDVLLEQAPGWFAHDPSTDDPQVRKRRATDLLTAMLGLGGSQ